MKSLDGKVSVVFQGSVSRNLPASSVFPSVSEASNFFEEGSLGYSPLKAEKRFDGIILKTSHWSVKPLHVERIFSSYFDDIQLFPKGSVEFDHALIMENIHHEWHSAADLYGI